MAEERTTNSSVVVELRPGCGDAQMVELPDGRMVGISRHPTRAHCLIVTLPREIRLERVLTYTQHVPVDVDVIQEVLEKWNTFDELGPDVTLEDLFEEAIA